MTRGRCWGRTARWLSVGVLVACLMPALPSAVAAPVTDPEAFETQLDAAVDASGVFAAGTTLVHDFRYQTQPARTIMLETVNPDGSAIVSITSTVSRVDVMCTGPGMCWERAWGKYLDTRWHALPPESVEFSDGYPGQPFGFPVGISGASYDISTPPDEPGTTVFTMVDQARALGEVDVTYAATVSPGRIDYAVTRANRDRPEWSESYEALATAVPVVAPDEADLGRPGSWTQSYYVMLRVNAPAEG